MKKKIFRIIFLGLVFLGIFSITTFAQAQNPDSPWPMFNGNPRHTGLSPKNDSKTNRAVEWSYKTGGAVESSPVIGADGTIYFGSHDGNLYALNPLGSEKWKLEIAKPVYDERWKTSKAIMATPAIAKDGTIYINGSSDYLHAVTPFGKDKWRFFIKWSNDFWNSPTVGDDGTIYIGTARNEGDNQHPAGLYALNPDGTEKWHYQEDSGVTVVPAVAYDGTIYFGAAEASTNRGRIIALSPDGKKRWQFDLEEWLEGSASIGQDGTIYSGSKEGIIYAINSEGKEKWRFKTENGISATPAIGPDGKIYIGSWDGNFYALDGKTGREVWRFNVRVGQDPKLFDGYPGKETICTSAAITVDGVIYFADVLNTIYALNLEGKELWRYKHNSGFVSSPAIAEDGTVYLGSEGGEVLAIGAGSDKAGSDKKSDKKPIAKLDDLSISNLIFVLAATLAILIIAVVSIFAWRRERVK